MQRKDQSSGVQSLHSNCFICNIQYPSFQATQPFSTLSKIRNFRSFSAGSIFNWAQLQKALHMVQLHQRKLHVFSHGLMVHHRAAGCGLVAAGPPGAERHLWSRKDTDSSAMTYKHENKEAQISSKQKDTIQTQCLRIKHSKSMWYSKYIRIESQEASFQLSIRPSQSFILLRQHMGLIRSQTFLAVSVTPARPLGASSSNRLPYSSQSWRIKNGMQNLRMGKEMPRNCEIPKALRWRGKLAKWSCKSCTRCKLSKHALKKVASDMSFVAIELSHWWLLQNMNTLMKWEWWQCEADVMMSRHLRWIVPWSDPLIVICCCCSHTAVATVEEGTFKAKSFKGSSVFVSSLGVCFKSSFHCLRFV